MSSTLKRGDLVINQSSYGHIEVVHAVAENGALDLFGDERSMVDAAYFEKFVPPVPKRKTSTHVGRVFVAVDPVPDANGAWTLRVCDVAGVLRHYEPVATIYDFKDALRTAILLNRFEIGADKDEKNPLMLPEDHPDVGEARFHGEVEAAG